MTITLSFSLGPPFSFNFLCLLVISFRSLFSLWCFACLCAVVSDEIDMLVSTLRKRSHFPRIVMMVLIAFVVFLGSLHHSYIYCSFLIDCGYLDPCFLERRHGISMHFALDLDIFWSVGKRIPNQSTSVHSISCQTNLFHSIPLVAVISIEFNFDRAPGQKDPQSRGGQMIFITL